MGIESADIIALLTLAAFVAGFIDAIAGGGGLVTVPALLLSGFNPVEALATNKLQGLFGAGAAAATYSRRGHVDLSTQWGSAAIAFSASAVGALALTRVPTDFIAPLMPVLLVAIALFFAFKRGLGDADRARRLSPFVFAATAVPVIAFYDGFFGPGTGSFFMLAFVALAGHGVLKATAHTKLLNFASNVGAFCVLALAGAMVWKIGLVMGVAQIAGAWVGSRLAIRNGARIIKPLLVITCLALAIRLWMQG